MAFFGRCARYRVMVFYRKGNGMKKWLFGVLLFCLTSCTTSSVSYEHDELKAGNGYFAVVVNTLDRIQMLEFRKKGGKDIRVRSFPVGTTLRLVEVPEGEYCFTRFWVYDLRVSFKDDFCFFVEEGEMNYPGDLIMRDPVTTLTSRPSAFAKLLQQNYPKICSEYLGKLCE